jgi:predicted PP-loop superfamily ATPase
MNGRIFMFGGAYQTGETIQYLNDFYELKVHLPSKYAKAKVDVKVINRNSEVSPRIESFLFPIQKNYLCLLGGRNS